MLVASSSGLKGTFKFKDFFLSVRLLKHVKHRKHVDASLNHFDAKYSQNSCFAFSCGLSVCQVFVTSTGYLSPLG